MVDVYRAYRRWAWRRLAFLGLILAAAFGVNLWIVVAQDSSVWLRIVSASLAVAVVAFLAYLLIQTFICARLQVEGERRLARRLRRELKPYRALSVAGLALLVAIAVVPTLFVWEAGIAPHHPRPAVRPTQPAAREATGVPTIRAADPFEQVQPPGQNESPAPALAAAERAVDVPPPPPPRPQIVPPVEGLPLTLKLDEWDLERLRVPERQDRPPTREPTPASPGEEEADLPGFRPDPRKFLEQAQEEQIHKVVRKGLPEEMAVEAWPPPEVRLDFMYFTKRDEIHGPGAALLIDYPFGRDDSIRISYLAATLSSDEGKLWDTEPSLTWGRFTLTYTRRIAGYTRHAVVDIALSGGLTGDFLNSPDDGLDVERKGRLAPYAGIEVGFWQEGPFGMILNAGRSMPLNVTGSSSAVSDFSLLLRLDVSERISLHFGYRVLVGHFRDYDEAFVREHPDKELRQTLAGPILGVDVRF